MARLKEQCGSCNGMRWCGRPCGMFKRGLVEGHGPAAAAEKPKSASPKKAPAPKKKSEIVKKVEAQIEVAKAAKRAKLVPHPDCAVCAHRREVTKNRMRQLRAKG